MRALIIDDEVRTLIAALITKAAANPTPLATVTRLAEVRSRSDKIINPMHDDYTIGIPSGFRVTYTHEHQKQCLCRHISISIGNAKPDHGPSPEAVAVLLEEFGFKNKMGSMPGWVNKAEDGRTVVEFIEPLDGDVRQLMQEERR